MLLGCFIKHEHSPIFIRVCLTIDPLAKNIHHFFYGPTRSGWAATCHALNFGGAYTGKMLKIAVFDLTTFS